MNFKLNVVNDKVSYIVKQKGENIGSDARLDTVRWMLAQGKPQKSDEFPGYPISVTVNGTEYHIAGEWLMGGEKDVLSDEPAEPAEQPKPKKRKNKESVLE